METKVTREMINAAHGVTMQKGDVILSADLLERIYLAMDSRREKDDQYFDGDADDVIRASNEKLRFALENCRLLAARHRKEDWALLILGFCAEGGAVGSVTR